MLNDTTVQKIIKMTRAGKLGWKRAGLDFYYYPDKKIPNSLWIFDKTSFFGYNVLWEREHYYSKINEELWNLVDSILPDEIKENLNSILSSNGW